MFEFLAEIRPGPKSVPAGDYAMWLPSSEEPRFASSETRHHLSRAYQAVQGVETLALAALLKQLGVIAQDVGRVALPEELVCFPVLGPEERVFVLSASREKGLRFHFHQSAPPAYRNKVLADFIAFAGSLRGAATLLGMPLDEVAAEPPGRWWEQCERIVTEMEANDEPVEAIGQVLMG